MTRSFNNGTKLKQFVIVRLCELVRNCLFFYRLTTWANEFIVDFDLHMIAYVTVNQRNISLQSIRCLCFFLNFVVSLCIEQLVWQL